MGGGFILRDVWVTASGAQGLYLDFHSRVNLGNLGIKPGLTTFKSLNFYSRVNLGSVQRNICSLKIKSGLTMFKSHIFYIFHRAKDNFLLNICFVENICPFLFLYDRVFPRHLSGMVSMCHLV